MRVISLPLLVLCAAMQCAAIALRAESEGATELRPVTDCRSAAQATEAVAGLPAGLLLAIGQVESGRADPGSGRVDPWPWATNHAGEGRYFSSAAEAIAWVSSQQALGIRSIDIGCFQVNLHHHPNAFASLSEAFDPAANARYAAAFLNRLHEQTGNWRTAVALYHSSDPYEGQRYASRVIEAWNSDGKITGVPVFASIASNDPVVVRISTAAAAVRVVMPAAYDGRTGTIAGKSQTGLPRVFGPSH